MAPHGPWDDQLALVFDSGTLDEDQVTNLRPHDQELSELRFAPATEAVAALRERLQHKLDAAVKALSDGAPGYLHDGAAIA